MTGKVLVSVGGTWHAPQLSYQFQRGGMLAEVVTTTPKARFLQRAPLDPSLIKWRPYPELVGTRAARILHLPRQFDPTLELARAKAFDQLASQRLKARKPDVFVAFARFGLHCFFQCQNRGIPSVVERGSSHVLFRDLLLKEERELWGLAPQESAISQKLLERELEEYDVADFISVPSLFAEQSFVKMGIPAAKIVRIPYGVNIERFKPNPAIKGEKFKVLCVGNLGVEKGLGYLLDAMTHLDPTSVELILIGSLDQYARDRLSQTTVPWTFLGRVNQLNLPRYYQAASVFCLLSVQEGMSMALMEALASGLPTISSEHTGSLDLLTDGVDGFIVPIRNSEIVAERLSRLQADTDLRLRMGEAARRRMMTQSWDDYGREVRERYNRIMHSPREDSKQA